MNGEAAILWCVISFWLGFAYRQWGVRRERRVHRGQLGVIPTRRETPCKPAIELSADSCLSERDKSVLLANGTRIRLAHRLGLDLALSRAGSRDEWLCPSDDPSADIGFVVVRNGDA